MSLYYPYQDQAAALPVVRNQGEVSGKLDIRLGEEAPQVVIPAAVEAPAAGEADQTAENTDCSVDPLEQCPTADSEADADTRHRMVASAPATSGPYACQPCSG
jgi:hypothetical protein